MSFTTVLGVMIGGGMLILAIAFGVTGNEMLVIDEPWGIFVNLSGLLIVLGGVIAATFISFPAQMIGRVFHSLIVVFKCLPMNFPLMRLLRSCANELSLDCALKWKSHNFSEQWRNFLPHLA